VKVITGSGDVSTFLAQLDQMAKANGVQLDLYEPTAAAAPADSSKPGNAPPPAQGQKPPTAADPLEVEGLQRNSMVLAARGSFPELLSFLRQLEALNVLVVQSDLQLNQEQKQAGGDDAAALQPEPVVLKLALSLYGKVVDADLAKVPGGSAEKSPANGGAAAPAVPN
jgi:type IV pilus assembly protein PilO